MSRSDQRLIKYSGEVYTPRTLKVLADHLEIPSDVTVVFDVANEAIKASLSDIQQLNDRFVTLHLLPFGQNDFTTPCSDSSCVLYRALLCGYSGYRSDILSSYFLCILSADSLNENEIRRCALTNQLFPPSVFSCMESPSFLSIFQQNVTNSLNSLLSDYADEKDMLELAAEDILLEAEEDNEYTLLPESPSFFGLDPSSLFPITFFYNAKRLFFKEGTLVETLCSLMNQQSFVCTGKTTVDAIYKPQTPVKEPHLAIFINILCKENSAFLDPLMKWLQEYPSYVS